MPGGRRAEAGPLNVSQLHSATVALVLALTAAGLYGYRRLRPGYRPEALGLAISRASLCAGAFGVNALLMYLESVLAFGGRTQALATAPVNLALVILVAAICSLQARSFGTLDVSPGARALLRHAPGALLLSFSAHLIFSLILPAPVLDRFSVAPTYYLLNRGLVSLPEAFFLGVAALVSLQAAGPREPVGRIRLQNAAFCGGQLLLVGVALNAYAVVCFRVFVGNDAFGAATRRSLVEEALARELWLVVGAAGLYALGFLLYYASGDRGRAISLFSAWRRGRQELDQQLWRLDAARLEDRYPDYALLSKASAELAARAVAEGDPRAFEPGDASAALQTFKLFVLGSRNPAALSALVHYHHALLRHPATADMSWRIAPPEAAAEAAAGRELDGGMFYRATEDRLPEAADRVRILLQQKAGPRLLAQPQWFQLATLAAACSGALPQARAAAVLRPGAVMDRVSRAHQNARFYYRLAPGTETLCPRTKAAPLADTRP